MQNRQDITLSKLLSKLLRHEAVQKGLRIGPDGFVLVSDILNNRYLKGQYTAEDIIRVVDNNNKQRFSLRYNNDILEICANQGHSLVCVTELNLTPISHLEETNVIHGTYYTTWSIIKTEGLNRMKRNHIHFSKGLPQDKNIISGIRKSAEVFIFINIKLAITEGIKFYRSVNGVLLSPGNENGVIAPKYFLKVCDKDGKLL